MQGVGKLETGALRPGQARAVLIRGHGCQHFREPGTRPDGSEPPHHLKVNFGPAFAHSLREDALSLQRGRYTTPNNDKYTNQLIAARVWGQDPLHI